MTYAIVTKFHGPTNHTGARISATTLMPRPSTNRPDRLFIPCEYKTNLEQNCINAARALCAKLNVPSLTTYIGAYHPGGYIFIAKTISAPTFNTGFYKET